VPVRGTGEQQAGKEGAEGHRQAGNAGDGRGADDGEQGMAAMNISGLLLWGT
jgi:hypothetical protein